MDKIAIIGLGYVGLPLYVELLSEGHNTLGFDLNKRRIEELQNGIDNTLEIESIRLKSLKNAKFSFVENDLKDYNIFIVTVPTPVTKSNTPDFTPLIKASEMISKFLKPGDIVVYESTVYPGATEEICVPILEKGSNLTFIKDFNVGYSPERINPGDKDHTVRKIKKIISASSKESLAKINDIYSSIIDAGLHIASNIKVAEAAKVIENAQRDINIAFMNELSMIFNKLDIDTNEVLEAASTKWNFLNFKPGLVGGHCIGVDPYYLAYKAESVGYKPEIILGGRRINDSVSDFVVKSLIKDSIKLKLDFNKLKVLILGVTFKENCPDYRNTKVIDIYKNLIDLNIKTEIFDPNVDIINFKNEYGIELKSDLNLQDYNICILAVSHKQFENINFKEANFDYVMDLKSMLPKEISKFRL